MPTLLANSDTLIVGVFATSMSTASVCTGIESSSTRTLDNAVDSLLSSFNILPPLSV
jgi:hypothetical protein